MLLSARFLIDVANVNSYEHAAQLEFNAGDTQTVHFQLIDGALDRAEQGFSPAGRRYMPPAGSTLQITMLNVDDAKKVVRFASQPFAQDPSIWAVSILGTDPLKGSVSLKFVLTEPSRTLNAQFVPGILLRVK
jgi:hypothetical protein